MNMHFSWGLFKIFYQRRFSKKLFTHWHICSTLGVNCVETSYIVSALLLKIAFWKIKNSDRTCNKCHSQAIISRNTRDVVALTYSWIFHYGDVIMGTIATQITSLTVVYSNVHSDADQEKHQSSASLAFVWGIHREPVNSPHKWPVTRKMFPFDDVIMYQNDGRDIRDVRHRKRVCRAWINEYIPPNI